MSTTEARLAFSGKQAADAAGITYRQLDYWARTDLIRPSITDARGSGSRRRYSAEDIAMLNFIRTMLDSGVRLDVVREAIETFREDGLREGTIVVVRNGEVFVFDPSVGLDAMVRCVREGPCHTFPIVFPDLRLGTCEHNDYHHLDYPHPPGRACKFWKPLDG